MYRDKLLKKYWTSQYQQTIEVLFDYMKNKENAIKN